MSNRFNKGGKKNSAPKFKIGGKVDDDQRQYFKDASKEIRNLGLKVVANRVKKTAAVDDLKASGRKVKKTYLPFKKAIQNHKIEREKQENLINESILRGEKPILPKKSFKEDDRSNEPSLKIGKFSNGTLYLNKHDVKNVFASKNKSNNNNSRGGRSGGGGGRGGSRGGRGGGRGGKR